MNQSNQQISDSLLIEQICCTSERCSATTNQAYRQLVNRHKDYAFTIAFQILQCREEAEEAAQDAFVSAFKALHTFRKEAKFTTWFYRIALNAALSHKERRRLATEEIEEARTIISDNSADNTKAAEQKYYISIALQKLSPEDSKMINLFYLKELSLDEIAEKITVEANTIKVRLHRARMRLAIELHRILNGEEIYLINA